MNHLIQGPEFDSSPTYAICLNAIFICLFYFTALPVLIPIVMFTLIFNYLIEKYLIIKNYSKCN